jgi:hypothetical protein
MKQLIFSIDPTTYNMFKGLRYEFKNIAIEIAYLNATPKKMSGDSDKLNKDIEKIIHNEKPSYKFFDINWDEKGSLCKVGRQMKDEYIVYFTIRKIVIL